MYVFVPQIVIFENVLKKVYIDCSEGEKVTSE